MRVSRKGKISWSRGNEELLAIKRQKDFGSLHGPLTVISGRCRMTWWRSLLTSILGGFVSLDRGGLDQVLARTVILPRLFHPLFPSDSYLVAPLFTDDTRRHVFSPRLFTFSTPVIFLLFLPRSRFLFLGAFSVHRTAPSTPESSSSFSCLGPHCGFQKIATKTAQFLVLTAA